MPVPVMSPEQVREHVDLALRMRSRGRSLDDNYRPRPSAAGQCPRRLVYHRRGIPPSNPPRPGLGLTFELGDVIHDMLDGILQNAGLPLELREHRIAIPFSRGIITGSFDRSVGGGTIIDYKSTADHMYRQMATSNVPLASHRLQTNLYLDGCRRAPALRTYTHAIIVAFNKETGQHWISPAFTWDPTLTQEAIRIFEAVETHTAAATLPDRPPHQVPDRYPCDTCPWRDACWGGTLPQSARTPIDLNTVLAKIERYDHLRREIGALTTAKDTIAGELRGVLVDAQTRAGEAAGWDVTLETTLRPTPDVALLTADVREAITWQKPVTQLHVRRRKAEKTKQAAGTSAQ